MATTCRTKDRPLGKEKRGISPSNSDAAHGQRSSRQPTNDKEKSTEKNIPNYLRPTISSRHEPVKLLKKNGHEETNNNQRFLRRRSFDRPPSASPRVQKALISPGRPLDRTGGPVLPREKKITVRSTSFPANKTTTSQKPVSDSRTSKTPKAVKSQPVPSRLSVKKNSTTSPITSPINKKECNASPSTDVPSSHDITQTVEDETKQEEKESLIHEVEEIVKVENEIEVHSEIPNSEKEEEVNAIDRDTEVNNEDEEKTKHCDISTVSEENEDVPQAAQIEETEDKSTEVNIVTQQEAKENVRDLDETSDCYPKETIIEEAKTEVAEEGEHQNVSEELASTEEIRDEEEVERKEQGEEGSEEINEEKEEPEVEVEGDGEEAKQDEAANVVSQRHEGQGNKESPAAYNAVIEETASKLLEKRKNRVKALVGAFETVIDYESSTSK